VLPLLLLIVSAGRLARRRTSLAPLHWTPRLQRPMPRLALPRLLLGCVLCAGIHGDVCSILHGSKCVSDELAQRIRDFNTVLNSGKHDLSDYRELRSLMTANGLDGKSVHVGHILPNAAWSCDNFCEAHGLSHCRCRRHASCSKSNPLNCGWNLMAQPANENVWLSDKEVPEDTCLHWGRDCSSTYLNPPVDALPGLKEL
jgi:hypothetical protein